MPTAHLISGLPCSGKTTYALRLREDVDGVLFTLDRWLLTAYGPYAILDVGHMEHFRRVLAGRDLIWEMASEFLQRDVDVILDDGFFLRDDRKKYAKLASDLGAAASIHFIDTPVDILRARVDQRNAELPRFNFRIDPKALDAFAAVFQKPSSDEGADVVLVQNDHALPDIPG